MQKNSGHVKNTIAWTITTEAGGCTVDVKAEYEIPGHLFGHLAEPVLRRLNEREADTMLHDLKDRSEAA